MDLSWSMHAVELNKLTVLFPSKFFYALKAKIFKHIGVVMGRDY